MGTVPTPASDRTDDAANDLIKYLVRRLERTAYDVERACRRCDGVEGQSRRQRQESDSRRCPNLPPAGNAAVERVHHKVHHQLVPDGLVCDKSLPHGAVPGERLARLWVGAVPFS